MNDITALAQGKSLRKKINRRLNDAFGFQRTSGGKHTTISLSIDECKSVLVALDELEAAEKRIAEPVSVPDERAAFEAFMEKRFKDCVDRRLVKNGDGEYFAWDMQVAWIVWQGRAAMLQAGNHTEQHLAMVNSPVIPDGWQLVPKEPTEAMNKAGWAAINEHDEINPTYRAMLEAAPRHEVNK